MSIRSAVGIALPGPTVNGALISDPGFGSRLDASGAAYVVIGADRRHGAQVLNPGIAATLLARRTRQVGLIVAASPQRDHPYNVARKVASIDHISHGRAALLGLSRDLDTDLGIGNGSTWISQEVGFEQLADALLAARKLWRTWPIESLDPDPDVSNSTELHYADHTGFFATAGPLNSPTTPQHEPLVFWEAAAGALAAELSAAAVADVVITEIDDLTEDLQLRADELRDAGSPIQFHVRATSVSQVGELASLPAVGGVLLSPPADQLDDVLAELASLIAVDSGAVGRGTLRQRLQVPRRTAPDLSDNRLAFPAPVPHDNVSHINVSHIKESA